MDRTPRDLGIARLPGGPILAGPGTSQLVEVLETYAPPTRPLYAVHASGGRVSPAARAFLEIAKKHLERLGWEAPATRD